MNEWKKLLSAAVITSSLAVGAIGVGGAGADGSAPEPVSEAEAAEAAPVPAVEQEQAGEIAQLRRGRTSDDALPSQWRATLTEDDENWGANPYLSRRTAPGVWIVPGHDYVCVASATPGDGGLGFGCATPEDMERGLLAPSDVDADGNGVLTGVLPDGVAAVRLVNRDGSTRSVDVTRNTYRAAIGPELKEVRFTGPDGAGHVLPMGWNG